MKIDDMTPSKSKFLTKEDVGETGKNLTISGFEQQEVGTENEKETKYVILWQQADYKPMVLNKENGNRLKLIAKTDDADQMVGTTVNVYNDPFVAFGGKTVGGIRIRAATTATARPQQRVAATVQRPAARPAAAPADDMGPDSPPLDAYEGEEAPY